MQKNIIFQKHQSTKKKHNPYTMIANNTWISPLEKKQNDNNDKTQQRKKKMVFFSIEYVL